MTLAEAEADRVVPKGFYSTTNHPTMVKYQDEWLHVEAIEMDCLIVVVPAEKRALCTPMSKLHKGDWVVMGDTGVRVEPPRSGRVRSVHLSLCTARSPLNGPVRQSYRKSLRR